MSEPNSTISIDEWQHIRKDIYSPLDTATPVEVEHTLRSLARSLGVPLQVVRQDYQAYLQEDRAHQPTTCNAATAAVRLVTATDTELWKSDTSIAYASLYVPDGTGADAAWHVEHHPIASKTFQLWLKQLYYQHTGRTLHNPALTDALEQLEAEAMFRGTTHRVYTRIGAHNGMIYLDLGTPDWRVVEVGPQGWRVLRSEEAPVHFRRSRYLQALPEPIPSSDGLERVLALMNLRTRRDHVVVQGWLVGALHPDGPYPILVLRGEKGAGKSTVAKMLKTLIDPTEAPLRHEPRTVEDLLISGTSTWVLAFDNLSGIPPWLSDAFCRLSTGGGLAKRQLYSDDEEIVLEASRPLIVTGISLGTLNDDLADRSLVVELSRIEDGTRLTDDELWEAFAADHAAALGQLLTVVSAALAGYDTTRQQLSTLPRMSNWAVWVEAAAPALGLTPGEAIQAYCGVQTEHHQDVVETDPVAMAILTLWNTLRDGETRAYSTGELLKALEATMSDDAAASRLDGWPRTVAGLGKRLPRLLTALRSVGVVISSHRDGHTKTNIWTLTKAAPASVATAPPLQPAPHQPPPAVRETPAAPTGARDGSVTIPTDPTANGGEQPPHGRTLRVVRLDGDLYRGRDYNPDILQDGGQVVF